MWKDPKNSHQLFTNMSGSKKRAYGSCGPAHLYNPTVSCTPCGPITCPRQVLFLFSKTQQNDSRSIRTIHRLHTYHRGVSSSNLFFNGELGFRDLNRWNLIKRKTKKKTTKHAQRQVRRADNLVAQVRRRHRHGEPFSQQDCRWIHQDRNRKQLIDFDNYFFFFCKLIDCYYINCDALC